MKNDSVCVCVCENKNKKNHCVFFITADYVCHHDQTKEGGKTKPGEKLKCRSLCLLLHHQAVALSFCFQFRKTNRNSFRRGDRSRTVQTASAVHEADETPSLVVSDVIIAGRLNRDLPLLCVFAPVWLRSRDWLKLVHSQRNRMLLLLFSCFMVWLNKDDVFWFSYSTDGDDNGLDSHGRGSGR